MTEIEPDVVELIVDRVTERFTAHVDARLDALELRMTALEKIIDNHADNIKHDTQFTRLLANQAFKELVDQLKKNPPDDDAPCPSSIKHAVAANPSDGDQRINLDEYGAVVILRPGADSKDVWDEVRTNLRRGRGAQ